MRAVKKLFRSRLSPLGVTLLSVLAVFVGTLVIRHLGLLQFLEFQCYDFFIRKQVRAATSDPIVLVELTEDDIHSPALDWPIPDHKLAELLALVEAAGPAVIGVDFWRDMPVPKNGVHLDELNRVLLAHSNIIAIYTLGELLRTVCGGMGSSLRRSFGTDPIGLRSTTISRSTFTWIARFRRLDAACCSTIRSRGESRYSLPFRLALAYLERKGIELAPDPTDPKAIRLGKAQLRAFRPNDGAYVGADASMWQMLLDFKCPDEFNRHTVSEVLAGGIPAETFRDKIVLVGINTPSVVDERVTPTHRSHHGIEVQALTIHQLLRQALDGDQPMRFWSDWLEDGWTLLWCVVAGAIGHTIRSPWRAAPAAMACLLGLGGMVWLAFNHGWWIPLVAPVTAFVPAGALVTSYVSFQEKKHREQLMQLFSRQVSPDIAQALWEQRDQFLAGQRPRSQNLTATVLFTDLEGFSTTSEKLDPAVLMDWLNEYMDAMATAIMAHHGVIEKYIGDAIMAVFGVPFARTSEEEIREDARNAIHCALAMAEKMRELNARWRERGLPETGMRIGIHTGGLVAGSLGSAERQEYTVLGDSVNTASRLESYDKDWVHPDSPHDECRILISDSTYIHVGQGERFETTRVGTMLLKNKHEPVTIHSVVAKLG